MNKERTGKRDPSLSLLHREMGPRCHATDLDLIVTPAELISDDETFLEHIDGKPVAIIEYKHRNAKSVKGNDYNVCAIQSLCNSAGIPCLIVRYDGIPKQGEDTFEFAACDWKDACNNSCWYVTPWNGVAHKLIDRDCDVMDYGVGRVNLSDVGYPVLTLKQYVLFMHGLRGIEVPDVVISKFKD
jgi:hypothetical protein